MTARDAFCRTRAVAARGDYAQPSSCSACGQRGHANSVSGKERKEQPAL